MLWGLVAAAVVTPAVPLSSAAAGGPPSEAPPSEIEVRLGFAGFVKIGVPLPLDVFLPPLPRTGPAVLSVDAPALGPAAGRVLTSTRVPFGAVAGAEQAIHLPVIVSDPRRPLGIRVSIQGQEVLSRAVPVSPERVASRLLVAVSQDHAGLASLRRLRVPVSAAYVDGAALPRRWQEYAAVDLLVIRDLTPSALGAAQEEALRTWIELGGRMLVVAGSTAPLPPSLEGMLPATAETPRMVRLKGPWPVGPIAVSPLTPRAGARTIRMSGLTAGAWKPLGRGRVTITALDPWQRTFLEWDGRLRWWDDMVGAAPAPAIDPAAIADKLPVATPLDPLVHVKVGVAILLYISAMLGLLRWRPTPAGWAAGVVLIAGGVAGFALLARATRSASATLTQVSVIWPSPGTTAEETSVAAVAVPYGGGYRIAVPPDMTVTPVSPSGSLEIVLSGTGAVLSGMLRAGEPARAFQATGAIPLHVSASLSAGGTRLKAFLERSPARHVELRVGGRVYRLGTLSAGPSVTSLRPDGWRPASEASPSSELFSAAIAAVFRRSDSGAILGATTSVLVGELDGAAAVFTFAGAASAPGQRLTILLLPLEQR